MHMKDLQKFCRGNGVNTATHCNQALARSRFRCIVRRFSQLKLDQTGTATTGIEHAPLLGKIIFSVW